MAMTFLDLVRREGAALPGPRLTVMAGISGIASAGILAVLNVTATRAASNESAMGLFFVFLILLALQIIASRFVLRSSAREVEMVVHGLRLRLIDKIRKASMPTLERLGRGEVYASIGKDTQTISQAAMVITNAAQAGVLLVFASVYLAWISVTAFLIAFGFVAVASWVHFRHGRALRRAYDEAMALERRLFDAVGDFVDGFKETKMHWRRSADLFAEFKTHSGAAAQSKIVAAGAIAGEVVFAQTALFLLVATMVFVVPVLSDGFSAKVVQTATVVLFMFGSISTVVTSAPMVAAANAAAASIMLLESQLDSNSAEQPGSDTELPAFGRFDALALRGVAYAHTDDLGHDGFALGPIDFAIKSGEMVFITGGNGSGKTTLLKVLVGLYTPQEGEILLNGQPLNAADQRGYRQLFSVVFNDFHLFRRLYGLLDAHPDRISELLDLLEIADKTAVVDGSFESLQLSGGQRKRIALLVALLEDRPVIVLDEWAADQDPAFKRKFYRDILPGLRKGGKTIVAITHDDAYFDVADRHVRMDYGRSTD